MKTVRVGILGFGTVGAGVVEGLRRNGARIAERTGLNLEVGGIADLDLETDRGVEVDRALLTADAASLVDDPGIDVVAELIGGEGAARELTLRALKAGKPVVTANKALLAEHGKEIFDAVERAEAGLYFEAAVGGGIPILRALCGGLVGERVERMYGILNGTCNYILSRMESDRLSFEHVLAEAQRAGYAEAEPGLDVDGFDTAHKAVILAALAYGAPLPMDGIRVRGIRGIASGEIEYAAELGYRIKLLAIVRQRENGIELRVEPALVPRQHPLASVGGVFNAVAVEGDLTGETMYYGRGAGRYPTASAVIGDLVQAAGDRAAGAAPRPRISSSRSLDLLPAGDAPLRCYLRLALIDRPGVLAKVAEVLGAHGISIASVLQKERREGEYAPVIVLTHKARESRYEAAVEAIRSLEVVGEDIVRLAIEDFDD
ncbi:homoserine dehydrogenase [Kiritimatiella glycovorans]|nr:homoserine dehydrogenase [Kiritimatiella glycovorans]